MTCSALHGELLLPSPPFTHTVLFGRLDLLRTRPEVGINFLNMLCSFPVFVFFDIFLDQTKSKFFLLIVLSFFQNVVCLRYGWLKIYLLISAFEHVWFLFLFFGLPVFRFWFCFQLF